MKIFNYLLLFLFLISCNRDDTIGKTSITKWPHGKAGAVSITYDDGIRTQFSEALPIMKRLNLPATFFIITGPITGSHYQPEFIGRPVKEIIRETAINPTNAANFFERESAARYLGYKGTLAYYDKADQLYERGKKAEAYATVDELYQKVRNGALKPGKDTSMEIANEKGLSWDTIKKYASQGYEFASHTVTHAHLAVLDTANMLYELRKSKADIREHLGPQYTFSAEVPFGIEDPRVMKIAFPVYSALRNSMPEPFMKEINRGHKEHPGAFDKEYVQWQRGPLSKTPLSLMKSWIDTTLSHNNIWLVLVFHGIDTVGWEPLPHELLASYFQYIKNHDDSLWIAPFGTVARYVRERMNAKVKTGLKSDTIMIDLTHSLDPAMYDVPLTLKTYIPKKWKEVAVAQGNHIQNVKGSSDKSGRFAKYQAAPNAGIVKVYQKHG